MDGLRIFLVALLGVVCNSHGQITGSVLEVTVRPGDDITLHCDCKLSTGVYIVWYRNCSHENQPSLVFRISRNSFKGPVADLTEHLRIFPRFRFVRNFSSESYDLLIENITDSDEGLYYCATAQTKVDDKQFIAERYDYRHGNVTTRITLGKDDPDSCPDCTSVHDVSWMMALIPAFTTLFSFLSFILVNCFCQRTDEDRQLLLKTPDNRRQTRWNQDEDLCLTRVVFRVKDGYGKL